MSLNGLDNAAVNEAYRAALTEGGYWFFLKYTSRDEVELLQKGSGGVMEAQEVVKSYGTESPLYGFILYRRRKVLLKYVPEGTSRLLQARVAVHLQSIEAKFTPHDAVFNFATAAELKDSALSSEIALHTAASIRPISESHLSGITEDDGDTRSVSTQKPDNVDRVGRQEEVSPPSIRDDAQTRHEKVAEILSAMRRQEHSISPSRSLHERRDSDTHKALPPLPEKAPYSPPKPRSIYEIGSRPSSSRQTRKMSSQSARPSARDLHSEYDYKPKVKLGPRPSIDSVSRPSTAGTNGVSRPVSTLPAGLRMPVRKAPAAPLRPRTEQKQAPFVSTPPPTMPLPPPPPSHQHFTFNSRSLHAVNGSSASIRSAHSKQPTMTQEKKRLMKALELRNKQLAVQKTSADSRPLEDKTPAGNSNELVRMDDESAVNMPSEVSNGIDPEAILRKGNEEHTSFGHNGVEASREHEPQDSPISAPEPSEGQSTQASSVSEDETPSQKPSHTSEETIKAEDREPLSMVELPLLQDSNGRNLQKSSISPTKDRYAGEIEKVTAAQREPTSAEQFTDKPRSALTTIFSEAKPLGQEVAPSANIGRRGSFTEPSPVVGEESIELSEHLNEPPPTRQPIILGRAKSGETQEEPVILEHADTPAFKAAEPHGPADSDPIQGVRAVADVPGDELPLPIQGRSSAGPDVDTHSTSETAPTPVFTKSRQEAMDIYETDVGKFMSLGDLTGASVEDVSQTRAFSQSYSVHEDMPSPETQRTNVHFPGATGAQLEDPPDEKPSATLEEEAVTLGQTATVPYPSLKQRTLMVDTQMAAPSSSHPTSADGETSPGEHRSKRRGVVSPLKRTSSPEQNDEQFLSDDSFMEELKTARVQEAKPVSVSKSPIKPVFSRTSTEPRPAIPNSHRRVSRPLADRPKNDPPPIPPTQSPIRSFSASPSPSMHAHPNVTPSTKKMGVSTSISQRIKALEQLSNRPTSPTLQSTPQAAFISIDHRKGSLRSRPGSPDLAADSSRPATAKPSPVASPPTGSEQSNKTPKPRPESISVTATIIRDPNDRSPAAPINSSEPRKTELYQSPLVVEHETMVLPPLLPLQPPRPQFARNPSARSGSSSSIDHNRATSPKISRRESFASWRSGSSCNGSDLDLPRSTSERSLGSVSVLSGNDKAEKKDSKSKRFLKRMSGITSAKRGFGSSLSPGPKQASILEHQEPSDAPPSSEVNLGDLNIQFPDTLLWKRRQMFVNAEGDLVLSPSSTERNPKILTKKFPLAEFRCPYIPDQDRQELPHSIILDFKNGSTLQCACETRRGQVDVFNSLRQAYTQYIS